MRYGGGHFDVSGHIDDDANLSLRVRSQVPDVARAAVVRSTGIRGGLRTDVRIERARELFSIDGSVGLVAPVYGSFGAKELVIEGSASADDDLDNLRVNANGASWGTTVFGYPVGDFEYKIGGKDPHFTARLRADRPACAHRRRASCADPRARTAATTCCSLRSRSACSAASPGAPRPTSRSSDDGIDVPAGVPRQRPQRLDLSGAYSYAKAYSVDATLQSFDLGGLRELSGLDLADLDGTIDGKLSLTGVPGHPRIDAQGSLRNGSLPRHERPDGLAVVGVGRAPLRHRRPSWCWPTRAASHCTPEESPATGADWLTQLSAGNYSFGIDTEHVPFEVARPWLAWLGMEPPPGTLTATVRGAGTIAVALPRRQESGRRPRAARLARPRHRARPRARRQARHAAHLAVADPRGPVGKLSGFIDARTERARRPV